MTCSAFVPCTLLLNCERLANLASNAVQNSRSLGGYAPHIFANPLEVRCTNLRRTHSLPAPVVLQNNRCQLLWLRVGFLRLADNLAVSSIMDSGQVLPVVTVQRKYANRDFFSAALSLRSSLLALGSTLVVRVVDNSFASEVSALQRIARIVGTNHVAVNWCAEFDTMNSASSRFNDLHVSLHGLRRRETCLSFLRAESQPVALLEAPSGMPQLPSKAHRLISDLLEKPVNAFYSEAAARERLTVLLKSYSGSRSKAAEFLNLVSAMTIEVILGCLSRARILHELDLRCRLTARRHLPHPFKSFFSKFATAPALSSLSIAAYDVNGSDRRGVEWNAETKTFVLKEWEHAETERRMKPKERWNEFWRRRRLFFMRSFFPDDVTPDYYSFTAWRFSQRCVSATIGVFGTSSLLFALGIRSGRIGQAAVVSWVLKDGLGRVGKMLWAGSMGKDFDVDPKRWRFRSAMLYALGNGLEIVTQIFPASFLLFATAANSMKQVSYLTSSATRNAMYRSFGDRSQNIANITAKGEAQIVVADLIGMACGIRLSKLLGSSRQNLLGTFIGLTVLDLFGIYMELRQVVFRSLNAERSHYLINQYVRKGEALSPSEVNRKERILLKPRYKEQIRLTSIAKAAKDPEELELLLKIFRKERFIISVPQSWPTSPCRLVLGREADNEDVLRAMLMIGHVRKGMKNRPLRTPLTLEDEEIILRTAQKSANKQFQTFLAAARNTGWNTDNLLFSTMKRRGYWGRDLSL